MDAQKLRNKDDTYPPAPSVEDDFSPSSSTRDFDEDCPELNEAYLQAYLAYKHLSEDGDQEEEEEKEKSGEGEEGEEEETPQILIEYAPATISATTSSTSLPPSQARTPYRIPTAAYCEDVVVPLHQQCPTWLRHHRTLNDPPAETRFVQETPLIHQATVRSFRKPSYPSSLRQKHQARCENCLRYPIVHHVDTSNFYPDNNAVSPEYFREACIPGYFSHISRGEASYFDVVARRGTVSDGYYRRNHEGSAGQAYSGGGGEIREAEVFGKFAEVFNTMRKIDADILALKKVLEGLLLERFGSRG